MKKALINYIKKEKFDDIYTPSYAIKPLLKYIPRNITVWECCDFGKSEITRLLKEHGCEVISTDKEENFFEYIPDKHFDMIITNPPYSLKDDFIAKCYEWGKPFALLLPIKGIYTKDEIITSLDHTIVKEEFKGRILVVEWNRKDDIEFPALLYTGNIKQKAEIGLIQVGFVGMYYQSNLYLKN